ncbi:putative translocation protein sec62, partial [Toxoplasma gondii MAS]
PGGYSKYASITDKQEGGQGTEEEGETNEENAEGKADEDEYSCLKQCGFASFEHLMQARCLVKCSCVGDLLESKCFAKCPEATQAALREAARDACEEEEKRKRRRH